jgi:GntR family transcriptional regulator, transcriptional repressor for pyruvate dehydrogenase complex
VDASDADVEHDGWQLPRDSRRSKPEVIEDRIEELILAGTIKRGASLPGEQELSRRFGVGRSSVRTALQRLQHRGLVDVEHGVGWRVTATLPPSSSEEGEDLLQEAEMIVEARIAVEPHAARLAARHATEKQLKEIAVANEQHAAAVRAGDVDDMVSTDEELHRLIIHAASNELIEGMYKVVEERAHPYRHRMFTEYGTEAMRRSVDGHTILVQFLRHRDPSAAVAMESHIRTFAPR